jgi:hypothetical protein
VLIFSAKASSDIGLTETSSMLAGEVKNLTVQPLMISEMQTVSNARYI